MTPKLTVDVQRFVLETPEWAAPFQVVDGTIFWVLTEDVIDIRRLVQEGIDESERGESAPWNVEEIKVAGRRHKQDRFA